MTGLSLGNLLEPAIKSQYNIRAVAAKGIYAVLEDRRSLQSILPQVLDAASDKDKAWLHEMLYGVLRNLPTLQFWLRPLLSNPIKAQSRVIEHLLYLGIYQLHFTRVAPHAAISETVDACDVLKQKHVKGLVNAVLRNFQRQQDTLTPPNDERIKLNLPKWFYKSLSNAYPENYAVIAAKQAEKPPVWLRINLHKTSAEKYSAMLTDAGVEHQNHPPVAMKLLQSVKVQQLPGYAEGLFSVQDKAAQFAAHYLAPQKGDRVLDACAAPGGKLAHLLELQPSLKECVAIDIDAGRLDSITENLLRLGHHNNVTLQVGDACHPESWNPSGELFDRILLDAPCSATGIIRRHPDILWLRKKQDIDNLVQLQKQILATLWQQLKPGGVLLYATCSILPEENSEQIKQFLQETDDAILNPVCDGDCRTTPGRQILPGESEMDGFYYAKLQKS